MMRECACAQCAETTGQFRNYYQCPDCGLYGHEKDDFQDNEGCCNECAEKESK